MNTNDDIFQGYGVEVILPNEDAFLKIAETLTRLGIASYKDKKTLYQSCNILHKSGRYVIIHFKSMFALDGRESTLNAEDVARQNIIVKLLVDWGLCTCPLLESKELDVSYLPRIKIIKFSEKRDWILKSKYTIGIKHYNTD